MSDHQNCVREFDVVVIGSGISGLTTALIMAKAGKKVAVLERDQAIAPLIRPYMRENCRFSPGLHFSGWIGEGGILQSYLRHLNVADGVEMTESDSGFGKLIWNDGQYRTEKTLERNVENWKQMFPKSSEAIAAYAREIKAVNNDNIFLNHRKGLHPSDPNNLNALTGLTLSEVLQQFDAAPEFIELVGSLNFLLTGSKADEIPFAVHASVVGGFYEFPGAISVSGITRLLNNFQRELKRYNVAVYCNCEVNRIIVDEQKKVTGVTTLDDKNFIAPIVVASYNPKLLLQHLDSKLLRPAYRARLQAAENTFGLYALFYELPHITDADEIGNCFVVRDNRVFNMLSTLPKTNDSKRILSCFASATTSEIPATDEQKQIAADAQRNFMDKKISENLPPEVCEKLVFLDFLKPWSYERYTKTICGAAYGLKQTANNFRFGHRVPIEGLYLVGQAVYPGFFGSLVSGFGLAREFFGINDFWLNYIIDDEDSRQEF